MLLSHFNQVQILRNTDFDGGVVQKELSPLVIPAGVALDLHVAMATALTQIVKVLQRVLEFLDFHRTAAFEPSNSDLVAQRRYKQQKRRSQHQTTQIKLWIEPRQQCNQLCTESYGHTELDHVHVLLVVF